MALESVAKTHNEIFIGLKSGYLAGFKLFDGYAILLLTDKKINFPMVIMGIKSASEMLKQHLEEERKDLERRNQIVKTGVESIGVAPTNEKLIPVLHQYIYIRTYALTAL